MQSKNDSKEKFTFGLKHYLLLFPIVLAIAWVFGSIILTIVLVFLLVYFVMAIGKSKYKTKRVSKKAEKKYRETNAVLDDMLPPR